MGINSNALIFLLGKVILFAGIAGGIALFSSIMILRSYLKKGRNNAQSI